MENEQYNEEVTAPETPDSVSAMDLLNELRQQQEQESEDSPEVIEDIDEVDVDSENSPEEDNDTHEEEGDDDELDIPELDPDLAQNPKLLKRWNQQWEGLLKRERRIQGQEQGFDVYQTYAKAFEKADTAREAIDHLVSQLAQYHGTSREEFLSVAKPTDSHPVEVDSWETEGWSSDGEAKLAQQNREITEKLSRLERETALIREERERLERERQFNDFVDEVGPRTIKQLAKTESGWKVSNEMVKTALQKFPQLPPVEAVMAAYPRELAKHYAAQTQSRAPKAPDLMPSSTRRGQQTINDPLKLSAIDILNGR